MSWIYLIVAGIFEIGWPVGLKMAQTPGKSVVGFIMAVVCMAISGYLLFLAQKAIPMGTAYAVWTGIGAVGAFVVGIYLYNDPASLLRILGVMAIVGGVVLLKMGGKYLFQPFFKDLKDLLLHSFIKVIKYNNCQ